MAAFFPAANKKAVASSATAFVKPTNSWTDYLPRMATLAALATRNFTTVFAGTMIV